jgi:hypothetical protein
VQAPSSQGISGNEAGLGDWRAGVAGPLAVGLNTMAGNAREKDRHQAIFFLFLGAKLYYECRL